MTELDKRRCSATTKSGQPCRAYAIRGTEPALCAIHAERAIGGAPEGNRNAVTHGFYARPEISDVIADLAARQAQLSQLIDACFEHLSPYSVPDLIRMLALHGQNASRIGRLLQQQQVLEPILADELTTIVDATLDYLNAAGDWSLDL